MIPFVAQLPVASTSQVTNFLMGGIAILAAIALWRQAFPAKEPPPEVNAALVEERLKKLEAKDAEDVRSRKAMHNEIAEAIKSIALLTQQLLHVPTMEDIRLEIDRSISAGAQRLSELTQLINANDQARQSDAKVALDRISALEAGKMDKPNWQGKTK